jgi:hypothetical protein
VVIKAKLETKISFSPLVRGRDREGVEIKHERNQNFYPDHNLPPTRRKEYPLQFCRG